MQSMKAHKHRDHLRREVRHTIAQADQYYALMIENGESPNIDAMGYVSYITLHIFRQLLDRPDMEADELASLLRAAQQEITHENAQLRQKPVRVPRPAFAPGNDDDSEWADLMAGFTVRANENEG